MKVRSERLAPPPLPKPCAGDCAVDHLSLDAFWMATDEGLSYAEVGDELGLTANAVNVRLHRFRVAQVLPDPRPVPTALRALAAAEEPPPPEPDGVKRCRTCWESKPVGSFIRNQCRDCRNRYQRAYRAGRRAS